VRAAGTVARLRVIVAGEQPEADRRLEIRAGAREAGRGLARDVVEVRRVAANDRADSDERVVALAGEQAPRRDRQLPRAGHPNDVHVIGSSAVADQGVERPVDEPLDDGLVESTGDDGEAAVLPGRRAREFGHYDARRCPSLSRLVRR
jgi:hypothetical protein